jgi:hypothetical protein
MPTSSLPVQLVADSLGVESICKSSYADSHELPARSQALSCLG